MELDKLIEDLNEYANWTARYKSNSLPFELEKTLCKAADVIRLLRECINEETNEKWRRGIDEVIGNDH